MLREIRHSRTALISDFYCELFMLLLTCSFFTNVYCSYIIANKKNPWLLKSPSSSLKMFFILSCSRSNKVLRLLHKTNHYSDKSECN